MAYFCRVCQRKNLLLPLSALKVEEPGSASEKSAPLHQNTRRHISQERRLNTQRCETVKSQPCNLYYRRKLFKNHNKAG